MADLTRLQRAIRQGDSGAVRALVQAVDVNLRCGWRVESPLHAASREGRPDVIACLVGAGAHTEVRDRNNDTPLLLAAWLGHSAAVAKLLASGARVDADGIPRSALHCACMQGHASCVSELLRGGADENVEDEDGNTPAQVVGTMRESLGRAEDLALIHEMLRRAPADRAWRRRGWLVLLRKRDCIAAGLLLVETPTSSPVAVTTRSAARRGAGVSDIDDCGSSGGSSNSFVLEGSTTPPGSLDRQPKKGAVGTRGNRGRQQAVVAGGPKVPPKRSCPARGYGGGGGVGGGSLRGKRKLSHVKKGVKNGATTVRSRRDGRCGAESAKDIENRHIFADLVARLIGLGAEGAFRCVLSFL